MEKVRRDLAFVSVQLLSPFVTVSTMGRKYTFVDMLGIFGELQFRKHLDAFVQKDMAQWF